MSISERVMAHHCEQLAVEIEDHFVLPPGTVTVERSDDGRVRDVIGGHRFRSRSTRLVGPLLAPHWGPDRWLRLVRSSRRRWRSLTASRTARASAGLSSMLHREDETRSRRRLAACPRL